MIDSLIKIKNFSKFIFLSYYINYNYTRIMLNVNRE